jgi:hypothetical protein
MLSHMPKAIPIEPPRAEDWISARRPRRLPSPVISVQGILNGEGEPPAKRVAARDLHEAIVYMRKRHSDLDILCIELVALIEVLCSTTKLD